MRSSLLILLITALLCADTVSPDHPPLFLHSDGAQVHIFLNSPIASGESAIVQRRAGELAWQSVTAPLQAKYSPSLLKNVFADNWETVLKENHATDEVSLWNRMTSDDFSSALLSFKDSTLAKLFGRVALDSTATLGQGYEYRLLRIVGSDTAASVPQILLHQAGEIPQAKAPQAFLKNNTPFVSFGFPVPIFNEEKAMDPIVGFNIYRISEGRRYRLNKTLLIRTIDSLVVQSDSVPAGIDTAHYQITGRTFWGEDIAIAPPISLALEDKMPPAVVRGLEIDKVGDKRVLKWTPLGEANLAGYRLFRGRTQDSLVAISPLLPARQSSFVDEAPLTGRLFYAVAATDSAGNEGRPAEKPYVIIEDKTPPEAVTALRATAKNGTITLQWEPSIAADLAGYAVLRATDAGAQGTMVTEARLPSASTSWSDSGLHLREGEEYYYRVLTYDLSRNQTPSEPVAVMLPDTTAPTAPARLKGSWDSACRVTLTWDRSESMDAQFYAIDSAGKELTIVSELQWRGSVQKPGSAVTYSVRAIDKSGNRSTAKSTAVSTRDPYPPAHPRNCHYAKERGEVRFSWAKVASRDLHSYRLYRSETGTAPWQKLAENIIEPTIALANLKPGFFQIRALDTSMNESEKNEIIAVQ